MSAPNEQAINDLAEEMRHLAWCSDKILSDIVPWHYGQPRAGLVILEMDLDDAEALKWLTGVLARKARRLDAITSGVAI